MTKAAAVNALRPPGTAEEAGAKHMRPLGPKGSVPPEGESRQTCLSQFPTSLPVRGFERSREQLYWGHKMCPRKSTQRRKDNTEQTPTGNGMESASQFNYHPHSCPSPKKPKDTESQDKSCVAQNP